MCLMEPSQHWLQCSLWQSGQYGRLLATLMLACCTQAGVEPHLGGPFRFLCERMLSPEFEHCYLRRGQLASAGHEVLGAG